MALIVIPRRVPWRRQPHIPQVDWSNPLNKGLVGHWVVINGQFIDLVSRRDGSYNNGAAAVQATEGPAVSYDGTDDFVSVADSDDSKYIGALTILCAALIETGSNYRHFAGKHSGAGGTVNPFDFRTSNAATPLMWLVRANGTAAREHSGPAVVLGEWARYAVRCGSQIENVPDFFINLTKTAGTLSSGSATGSATGSAADIRFGRRADNFLAMDGLMMDHRIYSRKLRDDEVFGIHENPWRTLKPRTQRFFLPIGGAPSLSSAATLRDGDKPIATQQKAVSVDALIRAADLLIGTPQKSLSVDALLADADKLSTVSRHEATLAAQLLDGDIAIAPAQKAGSISGLLKDADKATAAASKAALVTGLLLDGDLLIALGSQAESHLSAGVLSGADVLIAGVTTNRTVAGKAQDGDTLTVASAVDRLSAALGIDADTLTGAATSARSIGALIVEGDAAVAGIQSGRLQPALLIDGDILIITSSTVAQADLAGKINLTGRYAPQVSLVGVYAPAINLKGRVH